MEASARQLRKQTIDLMQVWNLGDTTTSLSDRFLAAHVEAVAAFKAAGRARYVGITTSFSQQYDAVEKAIGGLALDFVQLDFSIGARTPEQRLLPLARERGVAVIANRPFTTGNLFTRVAGKPLPPWAADFDCRSWAQFFLKYIVSHPAVTCAVPATSDPVHLRDNMGACVGRLPDEATRARMVQHFLTL
jgi:diketogulonate reductase-like aldo/keto reductase